MHKLKRSTIRFISLFTCLRNTPEFSRALRDAARQQRRLASASERALRHAPLTAGTTVLAMQLIAAQAIEPPRLKVTMPCNRYTVLNGITDLKSCGVEVRGCTELSTKDRRAMVAFITRSIGLKPAQQN